MNSLYSMLFSAFVDYTQQILGSIGTMLGAIVGWLLHYITNATGKFEIIIDEYKDKKSKSNDYAYKLRLFIYNSYIKPKYIRNIKVKFYEGKKMILESLPKEADDAVDFCYISNKKKIDVISAQSYNPIIVYLSDLIDAKHSDKLSKATQIIMFYENEKGKKKKLMVNKAFSISNVDIEEVMSFPS